MPTATLAAEREGAGTRRARAHLVAQLLSLAPFWVLLAVAGDPQARLLAPLQPVPVVLGVSADTLLGTAALGWMVIGTLVIRSARSPLVESLALLAFTIPATVIAALAAAVSLLPLGPR